MSRSRPVRRLAATAAAATLLPLLVGHAAVASDTAAAPVPGGPGVGDPYFPTYGNGGYDVQHYDLAVRYAPGTDRLSGHARIEARAERALSSFDLDLVGLTVRSVEVDGAPATWQRRGDQELVVTPAKPLARGKAFTVHVVYDGVPLPFSDPSLGTYGFLTTDDGAIAIGEPEVAAHWFPVNDHPSDKATYRIAITVPKDLEAISNGLDGHRTVDGDWATTTWDVRDPMASYLAFLAIGQFDVHRWKTASGLPVIDAIDSGIQGPLRGRIESSFAKQGEIVEAESRWFGPYPFEAVGGLVDDVRIGFALENQTRPTYSSGFWASDEPGVGDDVVVHELAHQWYGDSVALGQWQDVWLNEGFATYAEWLWNSRESGFTPQEQFDALYDGIPAGSDFWKLEVGDPGAARLFDGAVYLRGAMTVQALRASVGSEVFFDIMKTWAANRGGGNGNTQAFIALSERLSGRSLDGLFQRWLFSTSKPAPVGGGAVTTPARRAEVQAAMASWQAGLQSRLAHGQR